MNIGSYGKWSFSSWLILHLLPVFISMVLLLPFFSYLLKILHNISSCQTWLHLHSLLPWRCKFFANSPFLLEVWCLFPMFFGRSYSYHSFCSHFTTSTQFPQVENIMFESIRSSVQLTLLAISFGLWTFALLELNYSFFTVYFSITVSKREFCSWPPPSASVTPEYFSQQPQALCFWWLLNLPPILSHQTDLHLGWFIASLTKQNWAGSVASWYLSSSFLSYQQ